MVAVSGWWMQRSPRISGKKKKANLENIEAEEDEEKKNKKIQMIEGKRNRGKLGIKVRQRKQIMHR